MPSREDVKQRGGLAANPLRDAVPGWRIGLVQAEVIVDGGLEVRLLRHPGMVLLCITRLDQDVAVGEIQPAEAEDPALAAGERDHHGVVDGGDQRDVGVVEVAGDQRVGAAELLAHLGARRVGHRIRRGEPERDHRGSVDDRGGRSGDGGIARRARDHRRRLRRAAPCRREPDRPPPETPASPRHGSKLIL